MYEKIGIVVADFNADITHLMEKIAREQAKLLNANVIKTIHVPGVYDVPLAVKRLLANNDIDGVITLGCVLEGDTAHDEIVGNNAARKITDLSLEFNKPVALGISGPRMTHAQALKRLDGYARRATDACIKLIRNTKEE